MKTAQKKYDILIIGAGAAGMAAAVTAGERAPGARILVLEKKEEPGKKILATGNGRCNLSNRNCPGFPEIRSFFRHLGILTREEEGRIYPYTEDARDVRDALKDRMDQLGVECITGAAVTGIRPPEPGKPFRITWKGGETHADQVLLAAGGKAGPAFGTTGDGGKLAGSMGHRVTRLAPVLSAVETKEDLSRAAGVRTPAEVGVWSAEDPVFRERGELQITKYGISGIVVFNASRCLTIPEGKNLRNGFDDYTIRVDLAPDMKPEQVRTMLTEEKALRPDRTPLRVLLRRNLADFLWEQAGERVSEAAELLKNWPLHPKGVKGWDFAQVTKGGVPENEVDRTTMQSVFVPGLYLAGEVLDYDGPCGGYNLQHAWETGIRAGRAMAVRFSGEE